MTTFVAVSKSLQLQWLFNPSSALWFGGFYKRLVGVIKRLLRKVLGKALLSQSERHTVLYKIECAVNKRPLTLVGDLLDEVPMTPDKLIVVI